jgi:hypothetical protein
MDEAKHSDPGQFRLGPVLLPVRGRGLSRRSSGGSWRGEEATVGLLVDGALIWLEDILGPPKTSAPVKTTGGSRRTA